MIRRDTAAIGIALVVTAACGGGRGGNRRDFERMRVQQRAEPYREVMRSPPAGTVTRESGADTGAVGTGMAAGRMVAAVPVTMTPQRLAIGREKFRVYCAVCHGPAGFGGSTVAENMGPPRPPSLRSAAMLAQPAGFIFRVATDGFGRMPAYAPQLTAEERWAVVAYVERLQRTPPTSAEAVRDSLRARAIALTDSLGPAWRRP